MMTINASGADMTFWHVAARYLGRPLAGIRVAQLTGTVDPWLPAGMVTLNLPDTAGPDTGGLPAPGTTP